MGCVSAKKETRLQLEPVKTVNGLLKVTIEQACIDKPPSKLCSMDPYLKISMSNQQYRGFIHKKAGRLDLFNQSFQFIINSCYMAHGRSVSIEVWNKHIMGDKLIGMGIVDIEPIINFDQKNLMGSQIFSIPQQLNSSDQNNEVQIEQVQQQSKVCKCKRKLFLSRGTKKVGFLNTIFEFIQEPIVVVGLKFIYASLRKRSSMLMNMSIRIQVVAGEEVLSTQSHNDKDYKRPPSWQDQILLFNVPKSLQQCIIRILNDDKEIGRCKLKFNNIINKIGQHKFNEQFQINHTVTGQLNFIVLVGLYSIVNDSKKLLQRQISQQRQKQSSQHTLSKKIQFPLQKQKKLYDSQEKTNFQTQPNEQQSSKYNARLSTSYNLMDSQDLRQQ